MTTQPDPTTEPIPFGNATILGLTHIRLPARRRYLAHPQHPEPLTRDLDQAHRFPTHTDALQALEHPDHANIKRNYHPAPIPEHLAPQRLPNTDR